MIPGLGRSPREGKGYPLQYSCLENSMDRGAWQAKVHGVAKSQTQLSNRHQRFASRKTILLLWEAMPITEPHLRCPDQSERSSQDSTVCPRFLPGSHFHGNKECRHITLLPSPAATTDNILIHFFSVYSHCRNFAVDLNLMVITPQLHFKCCLFHVSS